MGAAYLIGWLDAAVVSLAERDGEVAVVGDGRLGDESAALAAVESEDAALAFLLRAAEADVAIRWRRMPFCTLSVRCDWQLIFLLRSAMNSSSCASYSSRFG
jgi:hypothetical protein